MLAKILRPLLLAVLLVGSSTGTVLSATATTEADPTPIELPSLEQANKLSSRQRLALAAKIVMAEEAEARQLALQLVLPMAEGGSREATRILARGISRFPETLGDDTARAKRPLTREAMNGSTSAIYAIARMYDAGIGVSKDSAEALKWYRWAAVRGLGSSIKRMALALTTGELGQKDIEQAHRWVLKLAKPNRASVLVAMAGKLYGSATDGDVATADSYVTEALAVDAPDSVSAALLALTRSQSSDLQAAARLYLDKAVASGNIDAITALASTSSTASPESLQNAVQVLAPLATKGNQPAIDQLIRLLRIEGLPNAIGQQVVAALTAAADAGNVAAAKTVAAALTLGSGASVSFDGAAKYLEIAAMGGDADAAYQLGMLYYSGLGIAADKSEGRKWLEKSAASGSKLAIAVLETL